LGTAINSITSQPNPRSKASKSTTEAGQVVSKPSTTNIMVVGNKVLPKRGNYTFSLKAKFPKSKDAHRRQVIIGFVGMIAFQLVSFG
jgi:hypothetical protein